MTPQTRTGQQIKLASFRTIQDSAQSLKNTWSDVTRYETMLVGPHCAVFGPLGLCCIGLAQQVGTKTGLIGFDWIRFYTCGREHTGLDPTLSRYMGS
ncbi:hypothetical protein BHE74_00052877 [Ensete ventricosum]|nr:hypothetical protein BHE74_00052877 [Ensete ventricosum]